MSLPTTIPGNFHLLFRVEGAAFRGGPHSIGDRDIYPFSNGVNITVRHVGNGFKQIEPVPGYDLALPDGLKINGDVVTITLIPKV